MRGAERLTEPLAYHGEGPLWDAKCGRLLFLDVLIGQIVAIDASGSVSRYQTPGPVATVIRRRKSGGFVIGTQVGVISADDNLIDFAPIAELIDDPTCRTNDGGCDPSGGFVIGSMAADGRPMAGAVYRIAPDHSVSQLLSPVSISNGVQWSRDGRRVFYVDSPTRTIDVFDFHVETGLWSGRRTHIEIDSAGVPDGIAIDEEDGLWVAIWGSGLINHYDAKGRLVESIRVPGVSQASSCAFGGIQRKTLFITTSRQGLPEDQEPEAGAVFALDTMYQGVDPFEFAG